MTDAHAPRPVEILLVEDNPGDVHLTMEALKDARIRNRVNVVEDGESAIRYIQRVGEFEGAVVPDLILLDLNLPRKTGLEVLQSVRENPTTKTTPVVVLTSSDRDSDIHTSYGLDANCYITKPVGAAEFVDVVRSITSFWFEIVRLPDTGVGTA